MPVDPTLALEIAAERIESAADALTRAGLASDAMAALFLRLGVEELARGHPEWGGPELLAIVSGLIADHLTHRGAL